MQKDRIRKILKCIGVICLIVFLSVIYSYLNSNYGIGIPCMFYKNFGIYCSGCGLTRAFGSMLELDFYQAFRYNAFSLVLLPLLVFIVISLIIGYIFDKPTLLNKIPTGVWIIFFVIFFIYGIIRNFIPYFMPTKI